MPVDVVTEIEIRRPRAEVAAYASDPDNATRWYRNIEAIEWETPRPLAVGTRLASSRASSAAAWRTRTSRANGKDLREIKRLLEA